MVLGLTNINVLMYHKGERSALCITSRSFEYNVIKIYVMNTIHIKSINNIYKMDAQ